MKTLTISVADDVYQRASQKAAAAETSLPEIVQDLLSEWSHEDVPPAREATESERRADFLKFLDALAARPLKPGPSVGPLNREELYQRGVSRYYTLLEPTLQLFEAALELCRRYQIGYYHAAIVAAARHLGCIKVHSEDLNDGQDYDGVRVENPFRGIATSPPP